MTNAKKARGPSNAIDARSSILSPLARVRLIFVKFVRIVRTKNHLNLMVVLYNAPNTERLHAREFKENVMPRFYFHLTSKENKIRDDSGKELDTLTDAHKHARALIDKILLHVGYDNTDLWKVVISTDQDEAQLIVPFAVSYSVRGQR